jgi:3-oxoacyl-[acyl-carrier-protein] synthase II
MADDRPAVISGLGAVSPFGGGVTALWKGLSSGQRALRPITLFPTDGLRNSIAGEVEGYPPPQSADQSTRALRFLFDAVDEALGDAGLAVASLEPRRAATVVATNFGGMSAAELALSGKTSGLQGYDFGLNTAKAAERAGFRGASVTLSLSCASGVAALVVALELIRADRADVVLAAGYDELSLFCLAGLSALRAVATGEVTPFDVNRTGTIFSEGAGVLVVESAAHAGARGAQPYCRLAGGAMNNDAYHMTAPEKEGRGIGQLMRMALADAGAEVGDVEHINLHGTGTRYNDLIETRAVKAVFGEAAGELVLTANKSMLGHAMGAAGSLESICTVKSLVEGLVPPTVGITEQDPECDLDYCADGPREVDMNCVLKNSYGIGGTNASAVFMKA